jgi:hypothetical protein
MRHMACANLQRNTRLPLRELGLGVGDAHAAARQVAAGVVVVCDLAALARAAQQRAKAALRTATHGVGLGASAARVFGAMRGVERRGARAFPPQRRRRTVQVGSPPWASQGSGCPCAVTSRVPVTRRKAPAGRPVARETARSASEPGTARRPGLDSTRHRVRPSRSRTSKLDDAIARADTPSGRRACNLADAASQPAKNSCTGAIPARCSLRKLS